MAMYGNVGVVLVHFRAAQKLNLSSSPHRRRRSGDENIGSDEQPIFPNGYAALLLKSPPPAPPALLRRIGVKELTGVGKVSSHHLSDRPFESAGIGRAPFARWNESGPFVNSGKKIALVPLLGSRRKAAKASARVSSAQVGRRSTTDIPSYWIPSVRHATPVGGGRRKGPRAAECRVEILARAADLKCR